MTATANNSLRIGIFRDRPVFQEAHDRYDSLVVPAHIAAYSVDGLWGFLAGVSDSKSGDRLDFTVDPMTYWLALPPQYWLRGSERGEAPDATLPVEAGDIRPAFSALLSAYGLREPATSSHTAEELVAQLDVTACLEFQRRGIGARSRKAVSKYAEILDLELGEDVFVPNRLLAPYLGIGPNALGAMATQVAWNERSLQEKRPGNSMWACLALNDDAPIEPLSDAGRSSLRLAEFDGIALWVGGLDEYGAKVEELRRYRRLIASMESPVWLIYSGYYGLLCIEDGVTEISHGIYYTENKRLAGPVGSGPPAERYYVPALHRFYEPVRAFGMIDLLPELACGCPECGSLSDLRAAAVAAPTAPGMRMAWIQRLQRHFLWARRAETEKARALTRGELLMEINATLNQIKGLSASARAGARLDARHLERWVTSFQ